VCLLRTFQRTGFVYDRVPVIRAAERSKETRGTLNRR